MVRGICYNSSQRPPWFPWHTARHCNVQSHTHTHNKVERTPKANRVQSHTYTGVQPRVIFPFFWLHWVFTASRGFLYLLQRGFSSCGAQA